MSSPRSYTSSLSQDIPSFTVSPGKKLGIFHLGASLFSVLGILEKHFLQFAHIDLSYDHEDPSKTDIVLDLLDVGVQLRFDGYNQRLKAIDVFKFDEATFLYSDSQVNPDSTLLSFARLYHLFGPSHGKYDRFRSAYVLEYPGLCLFFHVPEEFEQSCASKECDLTVSMRFPDGSDPILSHMLLFGGSDPDRPSAPAVHDAPDYSQYYLEPVDIVRGRGLSFSRRKLQIEFDESCQDILTKLGAPGSIFYKSKNTMSIHSAQHPQQSACDFFYNYFDIGIDLLFDGVHKRVKKFVIHSNVPGHYDFGRYARCNFHTQLSTELRQAHDAGELYYEASASNSEHEWNNKPIEPIVESPANSDIQPELINHEHESSRLGDNFDMPDLSEEEPFSVEQSIIDDQPHQHRQDFQLVDIDIKASQLSIEEMDESDEADDDEDDEDTDEETDEDTDKHDQTFVNSITSSLTSNETRDSFLIRPDTKWATVKSHLGSVCGQPVVVNRAPSPNSTNPFGPTLFYGYHDIIFEVTEADAIATVILFKP